MTLLPNELVGTHYRIVEKLGQGTFGATYLAEDLHAGGKKCAVKHFNFVSSDLTVFNKAKELFEREAKVLLELTEFRNSHIPHFIGSFDENKEFYLVQELIDGQTLREELRWKTKLEEDEVAELLEDMLEVLKILHSKNIIHRDIKPENLMRRRNDQNLFLIDFGSVKEVVAKLANSSPQNKPTKIFTTDYAPTEQIQGEPTFNSDIYSLGVTALEALTGLEPQKLKDPHTGKVIWPSQLKVSDRLVKILEKMVHEDYQMRYKTASAVLWEVKEFRKTQIVSPVGLPSIQTSPVQTVVSGTPSLSNLISQLNTCFKPLPIWLAFGILVPIVVGIAVPVAFVVTRANMAPRRPIVTPDTSSQKADTSQPTTPTPPPEDKENGTGNSLAPAVNCGPFRQLGEVCPEY